jgi:hypothetical protein
MSTGSLRVTNALAPSVVASLAAPPADGLLIHQPSRAAEQAGLRPGDVLVSLNGTPTGDAKAFDQAYRVAGKGPVPHVVLRGSKQLSIDADRFSIAHSGWVAVQRGIPIEARPPATVSGIDVTRASDVELVLQRRSNAFGAKAAGSVKGQKTHALTCSDGRLVLVSTIDFEEFGPHSSSTTSTTSYDAQGSLGLVATEWTDHVRGARVTGRANRGVLSLVPEGVDVTVGVPVGAATVPSLLVAFLPLLLAPEEGTSLHVSPVGEDAYPHWVAPSNGSFFPLEPTPLPRSLVCRGNELLAVGRRKIPCVRWDQEALGKAWASSWLSETDGTFVAAQRAATRVTSTAWL